MQCECLSLRHSFVKRLPKSSSKIFKFFYFQWNDGFDVQIRPLRFQDLEELQFLRDERAAIRENDAGMSRNWAEYLSVFDVPSLPSDSNDQIKITYNKPDTSSANKSKLID